MRNTPLGRHPIRLALLLSIGLALLAWGLTLDAQRNDRRAFAHGEEQHAGESFSTAPAAGTAQFNTTQRRQSAQVGDVTIDLQIRGPLETGRDVEFALTLQTTDPAVLEQAKVTVTARSGGGEQTPLTLASAAPGAYTTKARFGPPGPYQLVVAVAAGGRSAQAAFPYQVGAAGSTVVLAEATRQVLGIETQEAARQPLLEIVEATGEITGAPNAVVALTPRLPGRVLRTYPTLGQFVKRGEALAVIDSLDLAEVQGRVTQARARLSAAQVRLTTTRRFAETGETTRKPLEQAQSSLAGRKADVASMESEVALRRSSLARNERLFASGIVSQQQLDISRSDLDQAAARLADARQQLELAAIEADREATMWNEGLRGTRDISEADAEVAGARAELSAAEKTALLIGGQGAPGGSQVILASPIDGIVADQMVSVGEFADVTTPIFRIVNPAQLSARLQLFGDQAAQVHRGARVSVGSDPWGSRRIEGVVTYLSNLADRDTRATVAIVRLSAAAGPNIALGDFVRAQIVVGEQAAALQVPAAALLKLSDLSVVFVDVGLGAFEPRQVVTGVSAFGRIQIVSGLEPGESVLVQGNSQLLTQWQLQQAAH